MSQVTAQLEDAEINELREFLAKNKQEQDGLSLEETHGYLSGLISGPETMHLSVWLFNIFNGQGEFESEEQEDRIIGYLCRLYNHTAECIQNESMFPEAYFPIHPVRTETQADYQAIRDWCSAYSMGITHEDWNDVVDYQMITFPVIISSQSDDDEAFQAFCSDRKSTIEEVRRYFLPFIFPAITQLYAYLAQAKHHADISMLQEPDMEEHECHGECGTVH